ncbi:hypothetical protein FACS189472_13990 [Alphaproteobacteria bacterium]|nr:hypothetical protein FACS189472_13990 [Alphaproteobacteria bacterium]
MPVTSCRAIHSKILATSKENGRNRARQTRNKKMGTCEEEKEGNWKSRSELKGDPAFEIVRKKGTEKIGMTVRRILSLKW